MNLVRNQAGIVRHKDLLYIYGVKVRMALQPVKARLLVRDAEVEQHINCLRLDYVVDPWESSCKST